MPRKPSQNHYEMTRSELKKPLLLAAMLVSFAVFAFGQAPPPLLQDIKVAPAVRPTPLIQKTGSVTPAVPSARANAIRTLFPGLVDVDVPGHLAGDLKP